MGVGAVCPSSNRISIFVALALKVFLPILFIVHTTFNMITFIPPNYVAQQVTRTDMNVASICWGFTLGFGFLTTWEAMRQTLRARDPLRSTYVWMIWLELLVCLAFSIICWIHLDGGIPPRYVLYAEQPPPKQSHICIPY